MKDDEYLIPLLIDLGLITNEQVATARATMPTIVDILLERGVLTQQQLATAKGAHFGAPAVNLAEMSIDSKVIGLIPADLALKYRAIPIEENGGVLMVAISDPSDLDSIDCLIHLLGRNIAISIAAEPDIEKALQKYYGGAACEPVGTE